MRTLADQLDHDELVEIIMDQLMGISWEYDDDMHKCYRIARLSAVFVELFGKGLEKMSKARDWMLFLPFLSNYLVRLMNVIDTILIEKSIFSSSSPDRKIYSEWDNTVILLANNYLDSILFIFSKTVAQDVSKFPFDSVNIGLENGDTKRRYLGYYLLNLFYEKVILNFDLQLSKIYFEKFHSSYNFTKPAESILYNYNNPVYKPMFDIVHRCAKLAFSSGMYFDKLFQLQKSLEKDKSRSLSEDDEVMENDRQMINARLYPLGYDGVAAFLSLALYDKIMYSDACHLSAIGLFPKDLNDYTLAREYSGILLNLLTRSSERVSQVDKSVFVLLYLSDHIQKHITFDKLEKYIPGPCGGEAKFQVSKIIEILSSAASTCPDGSIRFMLYKLIEQFINFGDDETRVFFIHQLLEQCPFPSMNTATIGLLKDQIGKAFEDKGFSIFKSPYIVQNFFPAIYKFKTEWKSDIDSYWEDYNYIMQALNLYFYILRRDSKMNITTTWSSNSIDWMKGSYLDPLSDLLESLERNTKNEIEILQIKTMNHILDKIKERLR
ncbi:MAG: hypothetical protein EXX96DRAFT_549881 [Benjaminiella poitrasii]|nr:MAG: hypothetical protein EXX96DRAFT_549881 [Benjaminiella poitrasii]